MENTTPMLRQYNEIKKQHPQAILFFRLGDFYEMFYEDAKVASNILDLVLTGRSNGRSEKVPMCGIPYHSAEGYIAKLIKAGLKVAICEQVEDPVQAQGIVRRDVIRTITSGTYLDDQTTDSRYILALSFNGKVWGMAMIESTSGTIQANQYSDPQRIIEIIAKMPIYECIFAENDEEKIKELFRHHLVRMKNIILSPYDDWYFNAQMARKSLCDHFKIHNLSGFGIENHPLAQASSGALLEYLKQMNKQPLRHIDKISLYTDSSYVFISPAACYGLEMEGLLKFIDQTLTSLGKRKLRYWIYHPLKDIPAIEERQDAVTLLKDSAEIQRALENLLRNTPDLEKNISRLSCGYTSPKDMLAIRNTLLKIPLLQDALKNIQNQLFALEDIPELRELLEKTINPEMPLSHSEGKVIRTGYHTELDALKDLQENGRKWLQNLQAQEIKRTGINSLKIGFNQVFGYYIEITKANLNSVPSDYIRKQTLVNGERFITPELKTFEEKILTAEAKILKIENEILNELKQEILKHSVALHHFANHLATVDVLYALSVLSRLPIYIRPTLTDDTTIDIKDGRHPVVERTSSDSFVANDTLLDCSENHLIILTGPNMAGKSTYIRQTAILVILAQMGSYIPATAARIGIVDKIFTRIGAHDDISKGQSTFMVEMNETADILNNLSGRSLVILDEIGRGTSTSDGLSLAWALAEHLQQKKVRTMFATHFHELVALAEQYSGVKNYNVAVKEWKDEILFLHKIIPGGSDDSYGIYVAKLAGIPEAVIQRSKEILTELELKNDLKEKTKISPSGENQLSLFGQPAIGGGTESKLKTPTVSVPPPSSLSSSLIKEHSDALMKEIKAIIQSMDINSLTPLAALNKIHELKNKIEKG